LTGVRFDRLNANGLNQLFPKVLAWRYWVANDGPVQPVAAHCRKLDVSTRSAALVLARAAQLLPNCARGIPLCRRKLFDIQHVP